MLYAFHQERGSVWGVAGRGWSGPLATTIVDLPDFTVAKRKFSDSRYPTRGAVSDVD